MIEALVAGLLAGYGIATPVGAIATYLIALTARTSWRVGATAALGVATVDGAYATVAVLGGTALAAEIEPVAAPLRDLSTAVLLLLALLVARSGIRANGPAAVSGSTPVTPMKAYLRLIALTVVNPATVVYFVALVAGAPGSALVSPVPRLVFVLAAFGASVSWQMLLVCSGAVLGRALTGRRGRLCTALASSAVIALLAIRSANL